MPNGTTSAGKTCPRCGAKLSGDGPGGSCPACLISLAIPRIADEAGPGSSGTRAPESALLTQTVRHFGDYELQEQVARGGMGVVYRARQVSLNRLVALKMIAAGQLATPPSVQRFQAEAEAAARLDHPHIVPIYEIGEYDGQHYFSMKLIEGGTLADASLKPKAQSPKSVEEAARLVATVARAVHYAHQRGILHRDLKPTNILLDEQGQPHVTDFGLAKLIESDLDLTQTAAVLGTPCYMAPEQASGKSKQLTTAADIYSLGTILYELLTGNPPFRADTALETMRMVSEQEAVPPQVMNKYVEYDLDTICLKCLSKDPQKRYSSAEMLGQDLDRWLNREPILARPVGPAAKVWRWCRRKPALATSLLLVVILFLIVVIGSPIAVIRITYQRHKAQVNERLAQNEAEKSREVARFLKEMLANISTTTKQGRDAMAVMRETMRQAETRLDHELKGLPDVQAELRETIGLAYLETGDFSRAESLFREAVRLRRTFQSEEHPDIIDTKFHLMRAVWVQASHNHNRRAEAEQLTEETFKLHLKVDGSNNVRTAELLNFYAYTAKDHAAAERFNRGALAILHAIGATNDPAFGLTLQHLAHHLLHQDRFEESVFYALEAVTAQRGRFGDYDAATAEALTELAFAFREAKEFPKAVGQSRDAWQIRQKVSGATNEATLFALWLLAVTTFESGDLKNADQLLSDAPLNLISPDWLGRTTAGEEMRFWLIRTLTGLAHYHASNTASARRYAHEAARLACVFLLTRQSNPAARPWRIANAQSLTGGAFVASVAVDTDAELSVRVAMLVEAEPLLLDGLAGICVIPDIRAQIAEQFRREAVERLIQLYQLWDSLAPDSGHAADAAVWKARLDAFDESTVSLPALNRRTE